MKEISCAFCRGNGFDPFSRKSLAVSVKTQRLSMFLMIMFNAAGVCPTREWIRRLSCLARNAGGLHIWIMRIDRANGALPLLQICNQVEIINKGGTLYLFTLFWRLLLQSPSHGFRPFFFHEQSTNFQQAQTYEPSSRRNKKRLRSKQGKQVLCPAFVQAVIDLIKKGSVTGPHNEAWNLDDVLRKSGFHSRILSWILHKAKKEQGPRQVEFGTSGHHMPAI